MIDLYYAATGNGFRAAIALEECALEYRPHKVDLSKGEQKTEDYLKLNPMGAIPAMVDHDGPGGQKVTLLLSDPARRPCRRGPRCLHPLPHFRHE
jgi:GST-like protein